MNKKILIAALLCIGVIGAGGYGLYTLGMKRGIGMAPAATTAHTGATDPASGRKILYYHDPMVPGTRFDKPGKSPFMDMALVPVYADSDADQGSVAVSPRIEESLGVRTALVTEGELTPQVEAVGNIAFNERDQAIVQARATGYVERLHVRATLDRVSKGQPLVDLYVPDWVAAQEEFLSLKRMHGSDLASLVDAARQRMRQAGMSDEQIRRVETSGKVQARITLTAPISGVVVELSVREGMTVMPGATLFRINGLSTVWANAEVPESQSALLRPGAKVQARSPAAPGTSFDGTVQTILPEVNPATRTLKVRMELANPGDRLAPGMFVSMRFTDVRAAKALLIPTEAVIQTGKRTVVILAEDKGRFRPVEVEAGIEAGGQTEIRHGLQADQRVVVSSQFLIDSEASLRGVEDRLNGASQPVAATAPSHEGQATVEAVGPDALTLSHEPIPSLKWGAMTMDFKRPAQGGLPPNLKAGDRVSFEFYIDAGGLPQLTRVSPLAAQAAVPGSAGSAK
ncbi:MAG: efflux RND transporter periplasmic adaptor subunit [Burkholderiales bacterium]|nr:efflux RND transporter periplasmic adaptor subunit [Burkholderiales bacterium]